MSRRERELYQLFLEEVKRTFSGWDFSYVTRTGRMVSQPLPWSYASTILPYVRDVGSLLDMGTGGGEFLSLLHPFPPHTCATERYPPNIAIARRRLEPLGITVVEFAEDAKLPFTNNEFALIINRHESYAPGEVKRILQPGGFFITQQVGEENDLNINQLLEAQPDLNGKPWTVQSARQELEATGFNIIAADEAFPLTRFYDIGALVYYLKAIPWVVQDFSIKTHHAALQQLHEQIQREGYLDIREHRFIIVSQK